GDIDGEGHITLNDPIQLLGYLFQGAPAKLGCEKAADANDDGELDLGDALAILFAMFLGDLLPEPFASGLCGVDPTDDELPCDHYFPCGWPAEWKNDAGLEFIYVEPGTFLMGSPPDELGRSSDETLHQVTLTCGYYMGKYKVTQDQWLAVMK